MVYVHTYIRAVEINALITLISLLYIWTNGQNSICFASNNFTPYPFIMVCV